jgi:hypothetical protein
VPDLLQKQVDAVNAQRKAQWEAQSNATKPTGNLYFKNINYKDGLPQSTTYVPEQVKGQGTTAESLVEGPTEITVANGAAPPGKVIYRGTSAPDASGSGATPYNTNDPEWQADVQNAYQAAQGSASTLAEARLLQRAVNEYTAGGSNKLNVLLGNPEFAKVRQFVSGTNPLNGLQIAMALNTQSVLAQARSAQGGTVGGRVLQSEYEGMSKLLGTGQMDGPSLASAANNVAALADRKNSLDFAYAKYREIMPKGNAEAAATNQFGAAPVLQTAGDISVGAKLSPSQSSVQTPERIKGKLYRDAAGNRAMWNGTAFVPVQ